MINVLLVIGILGAVIALVFMGIILKIAGQESDNQIVETETEKFNEEEAINRLDKQPVFSGQSQTVSQ